MQTPSPGNDSFSGTPAMYMPHLVWMYRLEADMEVEGHELGSPFGAGLNRSIQNIVGGKVRGKNFEGDILKLGGADWATGVKGTHFYRLDARYTVKTTDGHYLYIRAKGVYRPGPQTDYQRASAAGESLPPTVTQKDVEFFSHLRIEAGEGPYNWLNGVVALGVMTCINERIIIDAYRLTNFPDREPEDLVCC